MILNQMTCTTMIQAKFCNKYIRPKQCINTHSVAYYVIKNASNGQIFIPSTLLELFIIVALVLEKKDII